MAQSKSLFKMAQDYIPGGVNSPVRAFRGVEGEPPFIKRGYGAYLDDNGIRNEHDCFRRNG